MHWIKAVVSVPLLPEYEVLWIVPIGARLIIFFGETTVVGVIQGKSEHDYNYKTDFQI